jgi:hypothetical protein
MERATRTDMQGPPYSPDLTMRTREERAARAGREDRNMSPAAPTLRAADAAAVPASAP